MCGWTDPTPGDGEFLCENCRQLFPTNSPTIVRQQYDTPGGKSEWHTFHEPGCAGEWQRRGGKHRYE